VIEEMLLRVSEPYVQAGTDVPKMRGRQELGAIAALGDRKLEVRRYREAPVGGHVLARQIGDAHLSHVWRLM